MKKKRIDVIRIIEKKLGREGADGQAFDWDNTIEIDPRLSSRIYLETIAHEVLHILDPEMQEATVSRYARILSKYIWKSGYRRIKE